MLIIAQLISKPSVSQKSNEILAAASKTASVFNRIVFLFFEILSFKSLSSYVLILVI